MTFFQRRQQPDGTMFTRLRLTYFNVTRTKTWFPVFFFLASPLVSPIVGQSISDGLSPTTGRVDFETEVQPILKNHCYSCHGPSKQESNYRLDVRDRAMKGGDYGVPPISAGDSKTSDLIGYVTGDDPDMTMPPVGSGASLTSKEIDTLVRWVDQGAAWPEHLSGKGQNEITTEHWAFQPIRKTGPPEVGDWPEAIFPIVNPIDQFIAIKLKEQGLTPSPQTDPVSLIRRLYLDLHGLQPTPESVLEFTNDFSPAAYESLVESVLEHSHYGERWARHWLDVVRFGESTGYEVNRDRANAYHYRDYVIEALNQDKSYRDFVREQLAGDVLGVDEATGFLVGGPNDIVKSPDVNLTLMQRQDELADYVHTTSASFLGLTVACARCHNHKFDAILQKDYYALQAIFSGVQHGERVLKNKLSTAKKAARSDKLAKLSQSLAQLAQWRTKAAQANPANGPALEAVNPKHNTDHFNPVLAKYIRFKIQQTNSGEPCLDELEIFSGGVNIALASLGSVPSSSGDYANNPKHLLKHINDGLYGNDHSWICDQIDGWVQIELPVISEIDRVDWGRDRTGTWGDRLPIDYEINVSKDGKTWQTVSSSSDRKPFLVNGKEPENAFIARLSGEDATAAQAAFADIVELRKQIAELNATNPMGYVGVFGPSQEIRRLHRGDPSDPREIVIPDTLTVMGTLGLKAQTPEPERRLKLAEWIVDPSNPLTARVIVNRVWQYHFGTGLVATPSDFGENGFKPTHPELLDWMAWQFMENGWSLKWLHRLILKSSTYRQSSTPRAAPARLDADCKFLWRFPPRRLEAEAIRDCVLQLSGKLNPKAGGPGFLLFEIDRENVHHYFPLKEFKPEHFRRMIYMTKIRQEQDAVFGVFDCPDGGQTIPKRNRSTTALQALNLLNSKFMLEQASFLKGRLERESGASVERQVRHAFELAFLRRPTEEELEDSIDLINNHGLAAFCRALLNANEFLFLS
ncbi:MAG: DUF1553 domain-containing protein [Mariniblastus sp.]|nr:DUF1553 domain-containing protein [Mariniblastus sp.]